nr:MAG TPA: hypothetical protein [Caudoviricetes sp.]
MREHQHNSQRQEQHNNSKQRIQPSAFRHLLPVLMDCIPRHASHACSPRLVRTRQ